MKFLFQLFFIISGLVMFDSNGGFDELKNIINAPSQQKKLESQLSYSEEMNSLLKLENQTLQKRLDASFDAQVRMQHLSNGKHFSMVLACDRLHLTGFKFTPCYVSNEEVLAAKKLEGSGFAIDGKVYALTFLFFTVLVGGILSMTVIALRFLNKISMATMAASLRYRLDPFYRQDVDRDYLENTEFLKRENDRMRESYFRIAKKIMHAQSYQKSLANKTNRTVKFLSDLEDQIVTKGNLRVEKLLELVEMEKRRFLELRQSFEGPQKIRKKAVE